MGQEEKELDTNLKISQQYQQFTKTTTDLACTS